MRKQLEASMAAGDDRLAPERLFAQMHRLAEHQDELGLETVKLVEGDVLIRQGESEDSLYLVLSGRLGVRVRHEDGIERTINELPVDSIVGELALLTGQPRTATIFAFEETCVLRVTAEDFAALATEQEGLLDDVSTVAAQRWQGLHLVGAMSELFGELDVETWSELQTRMEWRQLSPGDILFNEGDAADGLHIVVSGRLRVVSTGPTGAEQFIGEAGPGEIVGEYAILTGEPRTATIYAVRGTDVARLSTTAFENLVRERPELMRHLSTMLVRRLIKSQNSSELSPGVEPALRLTFALIPADASVDLVEFADELAASLSPYGSALVVNSERFDDSFGQPGGAQSALNAPNQPAIAAHLDAMETDNRYVLFVADNEVSPWTRRALNQADRIVIVANESSDPAPGPIEQLANEAVVPIRTDLVLLHPPEVEMPSGTLSWLDARNVQAHYHVRRGECAHLDRAARRMSGHAIALVCGGGAARGYAHLGIYRSLLELGVPLDYVGGTSMGAIMGGTFALEPAYAKCQAFAQWTADLGVLDRTVPMVALTASDNVRRIMQHVFGDLQIEDLWCPFFCVSTDLSAAEVRIHCRGSMWRAVRASMSIPGVFAPIVEDGHVLVDGGIMDNFPVEIMQILGETGRIIGVNVVPYRERQRTYDYDTEISGWRVLRNRANPFSKNLRVPSILEILGRTLEINGTRTSLGQQELTEVLIIPDARGFSPDAYDQWKALAERGYEASLEPLRKWQATQPDLTKP